VLLQPLVVPLSSSTVELQALCPAAGEGQPSWGPVVQPEVAKARRPGKRILGVFALEVGGCTRGLEPAPIGPLVTSWPNPNPAGGGLIVNGF
jgi:hypothetical protein